MTDVNKIGAGLVIAYAAVASGVAPASFFVAYAARENAIKLERLEQYHRSQHEYFFQGANERGLLDICDRNGSFGVFFKDECDVRHD